MVSASSLSQISSAAGSELPPNQLARRQVGSARSLLPPRYGQLGISSADTRKAVFDSFGLEFSDNIDEGADRFRLGGVAGDHRLEPSG